MYQRVVDALPESVPLLYMLMYGFLRWLSNNIKDVRDSIFVNVSKQKCFQRCDFQRFVNPIWLFVDTFRGKALNLFESEFVALKSDFKKLKILG